MRNLFFVLLIGIISSCAQEDTISPKRLTIAGFYSNNEIKNKDSVNHFQYNCHVAFQLIENDLEIFSNDWSDSGKRILSARLPLSGKEKDQFVKLVSSSLNAETPESSDPMIYDGLSYVVSEDNLYQNKYCVNQYGLGKNQESFLLGLVKKANEKKKTKFSSSLKKEIMYQTAIMHQLHFQEIKTINFLK